MGSYEARLPIAGFGAVPVDEVKKHIEMLRVEARTVPEWTGHPAVPNGL